MFAKVACKIVAPPCSMPTLGGCGVSTVLALESRASPPCEVQNCPRSDAACWFSIKSMYVLTFGMNKYRKSYRFSMACPLSLQFSSHFLGLLENNRSRKPAQARKKDTEPKRVPLFVNHVSRLCHFSQRSPHVRHISSLFFIFHHISSCSSCFILPVILQNKRTRAFA